LLCGCSAFSTATPPDYYQLDYEFQPSSCARPFSGAVRIWPFSASAPFDREQMVMIAPSSNVRISSHYNWVSPPAGMVADKLTRDLSLGKVFQDVVPIGNPMPAAYEMSGQIYRFALEENGSPPRAILDLEITLWQEKPLRLPLFRKHYHYLGPPLSGSDPSEYARSLAGLLSRLSLDLRSDICSLTQDSSRPAGD
jgi:ABC-type uncharacterized transport system auxiliary subunit